MIGRRLVSAIRRVLVWGGDVDPIPLDEFAYMVETGRASAILDIRQRDEYENGHIAGAILAPEEKALETVDRLGLERDSAILLYCHTHIRSSRVASRLMRMGYVRVQVLKNGIVGWKNAGLPTLKNGAGPLYGNIAASPGAAAEQTL